MSTLSLSKKIYYYNNIKSQMLAGFAKKMFTKDNYFSRNTYYKAILNQYSNFSSYTNFFHYAFNLNSIPSSIAIKPSVLEADTKSIIAKYGKPVFVLNESKLTIFVYKWKFNDIKTRCEIHFYDNVVFLVNYAYNQLNIREKDYIINTITRKYTGTDGEIDIRNCKLIDENSNMVCINDVLEGLKVTYLCNKESKWYNELSNDIRTKAEKKHAKIKLAEHQFYNNI